MILNGQCIWREIYKQSLQVCMKQLVSLFNLEHLCGCMCMCMLELKVNLGIIPQEPSLLLFYYT